MDAVFFSFIFFSFVASFSLPLYFLFENRIDPVFNFRMLFCSYIENENNNFLFFKVFADKLNLNTSWKFTFVTMLISNCFPQIWSKLATIKLPLHRIPFIKLQFIQSGVMVSHIYRNSIWKNVYCSKWILFQGFYCL